HPREHGKRLQRSAADRRRVPPLEERLEETLRAIECVVDGEFHVRMHVVEDGMLLGPITLAVNDLNTRHQQMTEEIVRIERVVGREGRMDDRARIAGAKGGW